MTRPQLADAGKEDTTVPVPVVQQPEPEHRGISFKTMNQRTKYIVMGVVAVALIIILGSVLTAYFYTKSTENIVRQKLQYKDNDGNDVDEDVEADEDTNVAKFTVRTPEGTFHIVHDYNRRLRTMRSPGSDRCTVSVLNTTDSVKDYVNSIDGEQVGDQSDVVELVEDVNPIPEPGFMSSQASDMCDGMPVHWAYNSCGNTNTTTSTGSDVSAQYLCYYRCYTVRNCYKSLWYYRCYWTRIYKWYCKY